MDNNSPALVFVSMIIYYDSHGFMSFMHAINVRKLHYHFDQCMVKVHNLFLFIQNQFSFMLTRIRSNLIIRIHSSNCCCILFLFISKFGAGYGVQYTFPRFLGAFGEYLRIRQLTSIENLIFKKYTIAVYESCQYNSINWNVP